MSSENKVSIDEIRTKLMLVWADSKKRNLVLVGLIVGLVVILQPLIFSEEPKKRVTQKPQELTSTFFSEEGLDEIKAVQANEAFKMVQSEIRDRQAEISQQRAEFQREREKMQDELTDYKLTLNELKREMETMRRGSNVNGSSLNGSGSTLSQQINSSSGSEFTPQPQAEYVPQPASSRAAPRKSRAFLPPAKGSGVRMVSANVERRINANGQVKETQIKTEQQLQREAALRKAKEAEQQKESDDVWLPAGSILSGVLITGMNAPTANSAQNDPFPTLMRIKGEAILPNHYTLDLGDCFLLAAGAGQLSDARVRIRSEAISCIRDDGRAIEVNVNAFAVGDDGKIGVPGTLVTRNREAIGRAIFAGVMSGISQAGAPQQIPQLNTNPGNDGPLFQAPDFSDVGQVSLFNGVGRGLDRVSQYYLDLADQMHPTVEINAGRSVDFVLQKGVTLKIRGAS